MDVFEKITCVLPDIVIPDPKDPVFICATCLEEVSFFYTIKNDSLQNCSRLKYFNALLKGSNNFQFNELNIIIESGELSTQRERLVENKTELNHKYLFLSDEIHPTHIKNENEKYDHYSQQFENDNSNLNYLQDDESSSSSNDRTQIDKNVSSYDVVDINKLPKKGFNLSYGKKSKQRLNKKSPFRCSDCDKAFKRRCQLEIHTRVHTGEKPFKCSTCQKSFTQSSHLYMHKIIHTGEKSYECDICQKKFIQKASLTRHMQSHSKKRPHKCAVCSNTFTRSESLSVHMRTHTGEKPHECHLCEYKSAYAGHLKKHIRTHTGEKPHFCNICKRSFTQSANLKEHKRRFHDDEHLN